MAAVSTYLNFPGTAEEAFEHYRRCFGTAYKDGFVRFADMPAQPGQPPLAEADRQKILHVSLPILGGHVIMGTDALASMGFTCTAGNHMHLNLEPDTREEADRLFTALSAGGTVETPLQEMFWGAYFGSFVDRFGIRWMVNCANP
jgi:PhnB protein